MCVCVCLGDDNADDDDCDANDWLTFYARDSDIPCYWAVVFDFSIVGQMMFYC